MIPVPDAVAAYDRMTHLLAQPGDTDLLIAAALQGGMPAQIMECGTDLKACVDTYTLYMADPTEANASAWLSADAVMRQFIATHTDIKGA